MPQLAGRRAVCVVLYSRADQTLSAPRTGDSPVEDTRQGARRRARRLRT